MFEFNIVFGTVTWLKFDVFNCELFLDKYNMYRSDQRFDVLSAKGGGVLINVAMSVFSEKVD